jgi:hypothetical protein
MKNFRKVCFAFKAYRAETFEAYLYPIDDTGHHLPQTRRLSALSFCQQTLRSLVKGVLSEKPPVPWISTLSFQIRAPLKIKWGLVAEAWKRAEEGPWSMKRWFRVKRGKKKELLSSQVQSRTWFMLGTVCLSYQAFEPDRLATLEQSYHNVRSEQAQWDPQSLGGQFSSHHRLWNSVIYFQGTVPVNNVIRLTLKNWIIRAMRLKVSNSHQLCRDRVTIRSWPSVSCIRKLAQIRIACSCPDMFKEELPGTLENHREIVRSGMNGILKILHCPIHTRLSTRWKWNFKA